MPPNGVRTLQVTLPSDPLLSGTDWYSVGVLYAPGTPLGVEVTNGVAATLKLPGSPVAAATGLRGGAGDRTSRDRWRAPYELRGPGAPPAGPARGIITIIAADGRPILPNIGRRRHASHDHLPRTPHSVSRRSSAPVRGEEPDESEELLDDPFGLPGSRLRGAGASPRAGVPSLSRTSQRPAVSVDRVFGRRTRQLETGTRSPQPTDSRGLRRCDAPVPSAPHAGLGASIPAVGIVLEYPMAERGRSY